MTHTLSFLPLGHLVVHVELHLRQVKVSAVIALMQKQCQNIYKTQLGRVCKLVFMTAYAFPATKCIVALLNIFRSAQQNFDKALQSETDSWLNIIRDS